VPAPRWRLTKPLRASIERGHPWIYDRALGKPPAIAPGAVVTIVDDAGPIATAFADPGAPIAARAIDAAIPDVAIDDAWAEHRAALAAGRRIGDPLLAGCDGIRWIHGENDRCPGLVVDGYAGTAVIAFDGAGAAAFWSPRVAAVLAGLRRAGAPIDAAWVKGDRGSEPYAIGTIPDEIVIRERDARFGVDVRRGQKTGFFLDQRLNRFLIGAHAAGATVLNLFAYTGGFSVHAGLGGARRVTSVDIAARVPGPGRRGRPALGGRDRRPAELRPERARPPGCPGVVPQAGARWPRRGRAGRPVRVRVVLEPRRAQ